MNKAFKLSSIVAALVVGGMLVGCGSSSSSHKKTDGNGSTGGGKVTIKSAQALVIDGLVEGADVSVVGSKQAKAKSDAAGKATVKYEDSIKNVVIMSKGGSSNGLPAPSMKNTMKEGTTVLNPFTTLAANEQNVSKILADLKVEGVTAEQAMGDYTKTENADFAKATVALGRIMYCADKAGSAADNATTAVTAAISGATGANTQQAIDSMGGNAEDATKAVAAVDANAKTVDAVEKAVAASLGAGKDGCKVDSSKPDPKPDPDGGDSFLPKPV